MDRAAKRCAARGCGAVYRQNGFLSPIAPSGNRPGEGRKRDSGLAQKGTMNVSARRKNSQGCSGKKFWQKGEEPKGGGSPQGRADAAPVGRITGRWTVGREGGGRAVTSRGRLDQTLGKERDTMGEKGQKHEGAKCFNQAGPL